MSNDEIFNFEEKWQALLDEIHFDRTIYDVDGFNHLVFDTYRFIRAVHTEDTISRKLLPLHRCIAQISILLDYEYLSNVPHSVQTALNESCWGLCYVIEHGFNSGYYEISLPIELRGHTPTGCADPEADMSTLEIYIKEFNDNVRYHHELGDDYDPNE